MYASCERLEAVWPVQVLFHISKYIVMSCCSLRVAN